MKENVGVVILAAGSSSRMGRPKQALRFGGSSLLRQCALAALGSVCTPVIVVTGANADISARELEGLDVRQVFNQHWKGGMASSIRAGINDLLDACPETDGCVILLCDQPFVTSDAISRLVFASRWAGKAIIASRYAGTFGVPALFNSSLFEELTQLEGTTGAKTVIARLAAETHFIDLPDGAVDIDTPDDYQQLISRGHSDKV